MARVRKEMPITVRGLECRMPSPLVAALRRSWRAIERRPRARRIEAVREVERHFLDALVKNAQAWALRSTAKRWEQRTRNASLAVLWLRTRASELEEG